jgi:hypothetical protein
MTTYLLAALLGLLCVVPVWADEDDEDTYHPGTLIHCGGAFIDPEGYLRIDCPVELEPYAVKTIYVQFGQSLPATPVLFSVNGAAYPIIANAVRSHPIAALARTGQDKRSYLKWRVFNVVAVEQYVTFHWLVQP